MRSTPAASSVDSTRSEHRRSATGALVRDALIVIVITALCGILAVRLEWNETFFALTRTHESLQVDELPVILLVFCLGLIWLSWRRTRDLAIELRARRGAEEELAEALRHNRMFGEQQIRTIDAERQHLAREIHDELGQYLNAIKIDAVTLRQGEMGGEPSGAACDRIVQSCDHVHAVISDMIRRLRPVGLDDLGLTAALENCVDHWRVRLPQTDVTLSVRGELDDLGETLSLTTYRLVQEGLTNCFRHADASHVEVAVERQSGEGQTRDTLTVSIHDDGRGVAASAAAVGFGLTGLRERVQMIGGTFGVDSNPGEGFGFLAQIPVTATPARPS